MLFYLTVYAIILTYIPAMCNVIVKVKQIGEEHFPKKTLTSAQTLFASHIDEIIPWTPLVVLPMQESICDRHIASSSVNITDKIVLLFEEFGGNCSVHSKALFAQINGARAVLMANINSDDVVSIPTDEQLLNTTIPVRSISPVEGNALWIEATFDHDLEAQIDSFAKLCLSRNDTVTSILEGIFEENVNNRGEYDTVEFVSHRVEKNMWYRGESIAKVQFLYTEIYMWYHDLKWWLSPTNYNPKDKDNVSDVIVYGYCRGGVKGILPACQECWQLFWVPTRLGSSSLSPTVADCSLQISSDISQCDTDINTNVIPQLPDTLCVEDVEGYTYDAHMDEHDEYATMNDLPEPSAAIKDNLGEYTLVGTHIHSFYKHSDKSLYIWRDTNINYWFVTQLDDGHDYDHQITLDTLRNSVHLFICRGGTMTAYDQRSNTQNYVVPGECYVFDEVKRESYSVDNLLSIDTICAYSDKQTDDAMNITKVMLALGSVTGIILGTICGICLYVVLLVNKHKKSNESHDDDECLMVDTDIGGASQHNIAINIPVSTDVTVINTEDNEEEGDSEWI